MLKIKSWRILGGLLLVFFLAGSSFAALNLKIGSTPITLIDSYYTRPSSPLVTTEKLKIASNISTYNSSPISDPDTGKDFSVYRAYLSGENCFYVRNASPSAPGGTIYVRVWKANPNTKGSYYSAFSSFANGALASTSGTLNAATNYKADVPYKPLVNKFEESTVTQGGKKTSTLKVYSTQSTATDGKREVTAYAWKMWQGAGTAAALKSAKVLASKTSSVLSLGEKDVKTGQTYWFAVRYSNWFGGTDNWSAPVSYTVSGSGGTIIVGSGGKLTKIYTLYKSAGEFGINTVTFPFDFTQTVSDEGSKKVALKTVADLLKLINTKAGAQVVSVFGYYDNYNQKQVGLSSITYSGTNIDTTKSSVVGAASVKAVLAEAINPDRAYQVSLSGISKVEFRLTGNSK